MPYPDELTWWQQFEADEAQLYAARNVTLDWAAFRWAARTAYDIGAGMDPERSKLIHLNELRAALGLPRASDPAPDLSACVGLEPGEALVRCVHGVLQPPRTIDGAFTVTKHVAWLLRDQGFGLLRKDSGENVARWHGIGFAAARLVLPDGHLYKILTDVPNGGPSWQDEGIDPTLVLFRIAPLDPSQ